MIVFNSRVVPEFMLWWQISYNSTILLLEKQTFVLAFCIYKINNKKRKIKYGPVNV